MRFQHGERGLTFSTVLRLTDRPSRGDSPNRTIYVDEGELPRVYFAAFAAGAQAEVERRTAAGQALLPLDVTVLDALVHPVDATERGFYDAGVRAVCALLE